MRHRPVIRRNEWENEMEEHFSLPIQKNEWIGHECAMFVVVVAVCRRKFFFSVGSNFRCFSTFFQLLARILWSLVCNRMRCVRGERERKKKLNGSHTRHMWCDKRHDGPCRHCLYRYTHISWVCFSVCIFFPHSSSSFSTSFPLASVFHNTKTNMA